MSALKRKNGPDAEAAKAAKGNPAKRTKTDTPDHKTKAAKTDKYNKAKDAESSNTPAKASVSTLLNEEEPMFPRGGGNILTPLEQKQIQMRAKADAQDEDELEDTSTTNVKKVKKDKTSRKSDKQASHPVRDEDSVRVESLNFKRLVKGSLVLGQITAINSLDIDVALPNNLSGRVPITAISDPLTARLENLENDSNAADDEEESDDKDVDLASLFTVGQYVRACVLSTSEDSTSAQKTKAKRRIELSLKPSDTNPDLSTDDVVTSTSLMASIVSVEDHGCIMDVGLQGLSVSGFLPSKEIDPSIGKDRIQPGNVFLCLVTGRSPNKKVVQLTTLVDKLGSLKALPYEATTINTFLPGCVVEVLVSETSWGGVVGKVLGNLDVTADLYHSGVASESVDLDAKYKIGSKIKARVICNFVTAREPKLGISLLPHILGLSQKMVGFKKAAKSPLAVHPVSTIIEKCVVKQVENDIGLFVEIGERGFRGSVHVSRVKDGKVDALYEASGPYKVDSEHRGRILGYNPIDGMFHLSFEQSVLDKQYLRLEDVPVGAVVNCKVQSVVVGAEGVKGLAVKLEDGISGFIMDRHLSDVQLQHPEKKFREGMSLKARVLSVDPRQRQMRLTLKKTLVNSDAPVITSFKEATVGMQVPGTITKVMPTGAAVQFYGFLRGFLPKSEMSEAFIRDPTEHFRAGQVVNLHIIEVDPEIKRLIVSCKDPSSFSVEKQSALKEIEIGDLVSGKVTEKTEDIILELEGTGLRATLPAGHLTDKSAKKCQSELKRIRVGQTLSGLMVIDKHDRRRAVALTRKPSMIEAQEQGKLLQDASSAKVGDVLAGYVRDVIPAGVLVQFGGETRALLPKSRIPADARAQHDFGMSKLQSLSVKIVSVIQDQGRLVAALASSEDTETAKAEFAVGAVATATVASIRDTQLNVRLGEGQHGRIDMSELFDKFEDMENPKLPLASYKHGDSITVRVLGTHDARNHRFLPISHRGSSHQVLELTAKPSDLKAKTVEPLTIEKVKVGSEHVAFVNSTTDKYIWVNLSPFVRSRMNGVDISDDLSALSNIPGNFPVGSALKVKVLSVNAETGRVDVSASRVSSTSALSWDDVKANDILAGRVTKSNERQVVVQLSADLAGPIHLPDIADDYSEAKPTSFKKNDIVKVSVVEADKSNKRLRLSTRPSRILNSAAKVADREITSASQVATGDIVRGFVKTVSDFGLFVLLGGHVTALVKIANLSDKFLKQWKDEFQVDQIVKGRVLSVDEGAGRIELSLKESAVEKDYVPLTTLHDIKEGQVLTGKVRKVEGFGAFIEVDHSANVRGLCHRSEMAETPVADPTKLYSEGDAVKVYVLLVDIEKKRVNFSLKPSHFDSDSDSEDEDDDDDMEDVEDDREPVDDEMEDVSGGALVVGPDADDSSEEEDEDEGGAKLGGLGAKYDWTADAFGTAAPAEDDDPSADAQEARKTRKKARIEVDKTAEMDVNGPQSATDYERLLMGQPDSSELWIAYMALQMQVSELSKAREIADRALRSINIREETEKLNVWIAYLNLEMVYGTKETLGEVFKRACQYNDELEVHERLASIYIRTGKHKEADDLFQKMVKKFGAKTPQLWLNYAHFLHITRSDPTRARALLPRAHQSLEAKHHLNTSVRFAALEWRSPSGDAEKGRTFFEGILAKFPKKGDVWLQLLDLEIGADGADEGVVRDVFERRVKVKGLKPVQARKWFEKWADWEAKKGGKKEVIMGRAGEWVKGYKARQAAKVEEDDEE